MLFPLGHSVRTVLEPTLLAAAMRAKRRWLGAVWVVSVAGSDRDGLCIGICHDEDAAMLLYEKPKQPMPTQRIQRSIASSRGIPNPKSNSANASHPLFLCPSLIHHIIQPHSSNSTPPKTPPNHPSAPPPPNAQNCQSAPSPLSPPPPAWKACPKRFSPNPLFFRACLTSSSTSESESHHPLTPKPIRLRSPRSLSSLSSSEITSPFASWISLPELTSFITFAFAFGESWRTFAAALRFRFSSRSRINLGFTLHPPPIRLAPLPSPTTT